MADKQKCMDCCNSLLRGELAAIETYSQAIEKFGKEPENSDVRGIRQEHEESASALRQHLTGMGAEPSEASGGWGDFATALEGSAKLQGGSPALAVLQQEEEHGIAQYMEALNNENVMEDIKALIRQKLLPALDGHVAALARIRNR
jgi:hypothetical protein